MENQMDHARCSELLPAYERGELPRVETAAVDDHLRGCEDCSQELAGLRALHAYSVEPLTSAERARIHGAISAAVDDDVQTVLAPAAKPLWARLAPALAGVATLAVIVTGAVLLGGDGGLSSQDSGAGGAGQSAPAAESAGDGGTDAAEGTLSDEVIRSTAFYAGDIGEVTSASLSRDTRKRRLAGLDRATLRGYMRAPLSAAAQNIEKEDDEGGYTTGGADFAGDEDVSRAARNVEALQLQADRAVGQQIADCSRSVTQQFPFPSVPVYAATARLRDDRILLVGFTWTKSDAAKGAEFMLWAWPIGDCRIPVFYGSSTPPK